MNAQHPFTGWLVAHTYAIVFLGSLIDATGLPFPGRVLLVAAGTLAAGGQADVRAVVVLGALGAAVTDHLWYFAGRRGGRRLLSLYCRVTGASARCQRRTTDYLQRYGGLTIIIGRFFAGVRVLAWPLAATSGIGHGRFLLLDALGATLWSATWVLLGYALGARWTAAAEQLANPLVLVLVAALVLAFLGVRLWRRARYGPATLAGR